METYQIQESQKILLPQAASQRMQQVAPEENPSTTRGDHTVPSEVSGLFRVNMYNEFLSKLFPHIPKTAIQSVTAPYANQINIWFAKRTEKLLERIFQARDSLYLLEGDGSYRTLIESSRVVTEQQLEEFSSEDKRVVFFPLLSLMLEKPENYRFHLAVILSQVSLQGMPKELKSRLEHALGLSDDGLSPNHPRFKIKLNYEGWWLCGKAEPRLKDSIKRRAVMLVNDGELLVKFTGRLTALCLKTFTTNDGCAFLAGVWYSPIDEEIREALRRAFDNGDSRIRLEHGAWTVIRGLISHGEQDPEQILQEAQQCAEQLPERLPEQIGGLSRPAYRQANHEE